MLKVVDTVPLFPSLGWGKQSFSLTLSAPFKAMEPLCKSSLYHASPPKPFFLVDKQYAECPTANAYATSGSPSISPLQLLINM